jgi:hypothetical protein
MDLRHADAVTLMGWYFMTPSLGISDGKTFVDTAAPISRWQIHSSYDKASECENYKDGLFKRYSAKQPSNLSNLRNTEERVAVERARD